MSVAAMFVIWSFYVSFAVSIYMNQSRHLKKMKRRSVPCEVVERLINEGWTPEGVEPDSERVTLVAPSGVGKPDYVFDNPAHRMPYLKSTMDYIEEYCFRQEYAHPAFKIFFFIP